MPNNIRFAGLRVLLYTLKEDPDLSVADWYRDREIGEIVAGSANFSINSIPTFTIQVPPGIQITERDASGVEPVSYAERTENNLLREAYLKRQPVGIYLSCRQENSTNSLLPETGAQDACLFKGYILTWSSGFGNDSCTHTLVLMHWLIDLHIFPVINRLSSPENPVDLSYHAFFRLPEDWGALEPRTTAAPMANTGPVWTPAYLSYQDSREKKEPFPGKLVLQLLSYTLKDIDKLREGQPGYLSKSLLTKTKQALEKIEASKYGTLNETLLTEGTVPAAVANWILSQNYTAYAGVTIWQKLVTSLLPELYLCLIPTCTNVYIVPTPGLRLKECKTLQLEHMTSLQYRQTNKSTLGGMMLCIRNCPELERVLTTSAPAAPTTFQCPAELEPGVLKGCFMPGWLIQALHLQGVFTNRQIPEGMLAADDAAQTAQDNAQDHLSGPLDELCQAFVNTSYLDEVTKSNSVTLTTPLRFDLLPGDVVKIPLPVNQMRPAESEYVFGSIRTVSYTIKHGAVQSSYVINNIRTPELVDKLGEITNFLYTKHWRGEEDLDIKLYTME